MIDRTGDTYSNGQGDIVKIIDGNGATVVEYAYNSWGKPLSCTGTLATTLGKLNPFRYRGYVYDEETQWYYLRSRYYDPETCRFISADVLLSTGQGVLGHNCYAYCLNNPVRYKDTLGKDAGDTFSSELEALYDFYACYAEKSRSDQLEYVTFIHSRQNDKGELEYYYDPVRIGAHDNCIIQLLFMYAKVHTTFGGPVIMVHTHSAPDDGSCLHSNWLRKKQYCNPAGLSFGDKLCLFVFGEIYAVYAVLPDGRVYGTRYWMFRKRDTAFRFNDTETSDDEWNKPNNVNRGGGARMCFNVNMLY